MMLVVTLMAAGSIYSLRANPTPGTGCCVPTCCVVTVKKAKLGVLGFQR